MSKRKKPVKKLVKRRNKNNITNNIIIKNNVAPTKSRKKRINRKVKAMNNELKLLEQQLMQRRAYNGGNSAVSTNNLQFNDLKHQLLDNKDKMQNTDREHEKQILLLEHKIEDDEILNNMKYNHQQDIIIYICCKFTK